MWIHHDQGDREFSRYMSLLENYKQMHKAVIELKDAEDLLDLENQIDQIIRAF